MECHFASFATPRLLIINALSSGKINHVFGPDPRTTEAKVAKRCLGTASQEGFQSDLRSGTKKLADRFEIVDPVANSLDHHQNRHAK